MKKAYPDKLSIIICLKWHPQQIKKNQSHIKHSKQENHREND
jgi:hypothetical protein